MTERVLFGPGGATEATLQAILTKRPDAAEYRGLLVATINFATTGAHPIVTINPGERFVLRRFLFTAASVPNVAGDPVLTFTLGGIGYRSRIFSGRFDVIGDDGEDFVLTSSKDGQVDGTVFYEKV